ncbi:hypothetical protein SNEBB_007259, partial [Seison nebaliae]
MSNGNATMQQLSNNVSNSSFMFPNQSPYQSMQINPNSYTDNINNVAAAVAAAAAANSIYSLDSFQFQQQQQQQHRPQPQHQLLTNASRSTSNLLKSSNSSFQLHSAAAAVAAAAAVTGNSQQPTQVTSNKRETGVIAKICNNYGFIECVERQCRLFFHVSQYAGNLGLAEIGEIVEFEEGKDRRTDLPLATKIHTMITPTQMVLKNANIPLPAHLSFVNNQIVNYGGNQHHHPTSQQQQQQQQQQQTSFVPNNSLFNHLTSSATCLSSYQNQKLYSTLQQQQQQQQQQTNDLAAGNVMNGVGDISQLIQQQQRLLLSSSSQVDRSVENEMKDANYLNGIVVMVPNGMKMIRYKTQLNKFTEIPFSNEGESMLFNKNDLVSFRLITKQNDTSTFYAADIKSLHQSRLKFRVNLSGDKKRMTSKLKNKMNAIPNRLRMAFVNDKSDNDLDDNQNNDEIENNNNSEIPNDNEMDESQLYGKSLMLDEADNFFPYDDNDGTTNLKAMRAVANFHQKSVHFQSTPNLNKMSMNNGTFDDQSMNIDLSASPSGDYYNNTNELNTSMKKLSISNGYADDESIEKDANSFLSRSISNYSFDRQQRMNDQRNNPTSTNQNNRSNSGFNIYDRYYLDESTVRSMEEEADLMNRSNNNENKVWYSTSSTQAPTTTTTTTTTGITSSSLSSTTSNQLLRPKSLHLSSNFNQHSLWQQQQQQQQQQHSQSSYQSNYHTSKQQQQQPQSLSNTNRKFQMSSIQSSGQFGNNYHLDDYLFNRSMVNLNSRKNYEGMTNFNKHDPINRMSSTYRC